MYHFCKETETTPIPPESLFFCRLTQRKWSVLHAVLSSPAHSKIELCPTGTDYSKTASTRPFIEVHRLDIKTVLHSDTDAEAYAALERTMRDDLDMEPKDYTFRILLS
jgi:hypothetical protein